MRTIKKSHPGNNHNLITAQQNNGIPASSTAATIGLVAITRITIRISAMTKPALFRHNHLTVDVILLIYPMMAVWLPELI